VSLFPLYPKVHGNPNCSKKANQRSQQQQQQQAPQQAQTNLASTPSRAGRPPHTPKNHNRTGQNVSTTRTTVKTPTPENSGQRVVMKSAVRHVSQLVNNVPVEREINTVVSGGGKNGFGSLQDGDYESNEQYYYRVFYLGQALKSDSRTLEALFKNRLFPHYPELKHKPFHLYYNDDEGVKIHIIDEECFSIFLILDIPKDLYVELEQ